MPTDEVGLDVTLERAIQAPSVAGVYPTALQLGATHTVRVYGLNLGAQTASAAIDLGPGIDAVAVADAAGDRLDLQVRATPPPSLRVGICFSIRRRSQTP